MQRLHNQTKKCLIHIPFDQKHSEEKKREVILDISLDISLREGFTFNTTLQRNSPLKQTL